MATVEGFFAWLMGGVAELLSGTLVDSGGVLGDLGEVLGVMLAPRMAAKSGKYRKKYGSKRQAVPYLFLVVFVSKIRSRGDPKVSM